MISSEVHLQPTSQPSAWDLVDVGWGADGSGATWRIEHRHREENPAVYDVVVRDGDGAAEGRTPIAPSRALHGGTTFIMSSIALPHIHAVDQLGIHRTHGQPLFTAADHRLLRLLHVELARFWRKDVLARARDPRQDLPPRLRQTLALLVAGRSEKEISGAIGISPHTVHTT